nr:hypothetical protein [Tanacetum cinerariifolium]
MNVIHWLLKLFWMDIRLCISYNPDHAQAQPVGLGNDFAPHWIGGNIPNNQNGWIEEDPKEEEEDPEEDPEEVPEEDPEEKDDDDVMEMDNEAEVIEPYMDDGSNNPPPSNSEDEETPPTSPVIPDVDGQPIPPIASFGQNFHFGESSSTANILTENSKIDTEGRMKKKFKEQDRHFVGLGCDNIEMDMGVRNVTSDLSGLKKLFNGLSDRFDEYEGSKVFKDKKVLEKETMPPRRSTRGNSPHMLTHDTMNRMIQESVEAAIRAVKENFMKCSPITFRENEKAVENMKGEVTSSEPTLNKAVRMAHTLMEQKVKAIAEREADNKRKWENFQGGSSSGGGNSNSNRNNYPSNRNYSSNRNNQNQYRNTNRNHQNNQRQGNVRAITNVENQNTNEVGQNVKYNKCGMQHYGNCPIKCNKCGKIGHKARECWSKVVATGANAQPIVTCYGCGEKGHIKANCPARNNPRRSGARGQAYALRDGDRNLGPNVVKETFLLNNCYARVLFDSGSDKSFVNEVHVSLKKRTLVVKGDDCVSRPKVVSCMKVKYMDRGNYLFVAQVVEKEPAERRLEDVPVICEFSDMFPELMTPTP